MKSYSDVLVASLGTKALGLNSLYRMTVACSGPDHPGEQWAPLKHMITGRIRWILYGSATNGVVRCEPLTTEKARAIMWSVKYIAGHVTHRVLLKHWAGHARMGLGALLGVYPDDEELEALKRFVVVLQDIGCILRTDSREYIKGRIEFVRIALAEVMEAEK